MTSVSRGGLELYVRDLILQLNKKGLKQVVVCDKNSFINQELGKMGIPCYSIAPGSRYSLARIARLRKIHRENNIEIWHSHQRDDMILVALAFYFSRVRHIFSLYMGFARKRDLLHRLVYGKVERLVTTSELMNGLALERLPVRPGQVACIRYGRDENLLARDLNVRNRVRRELGIKASQRLVISLCRLDPMKGVREFAEASRLLDNQKKGKFVFLQIGERTISSFDTAGKPVYLPESDAVYQQLVAAERGAKSSKRFKLLPFQKNYERYLMAADYFVLGSYDEMYSLSVIDAMLAGCFIIGTNNGGTVEQLADGRGVLIDSKSPPAIAEALLYAESKPAIRAKIQAKGEKWALQEHTWRKVLPRWQKLYQGIHE